MMVFVFEGYELSRCPLVAPAHHRLTVFELYGEPDVAGIARMLRTPDVGHEYMSAVVEGEYESALPVEGLLGIRTDARVCVLCPRPHDAGS